jgi:hypothetical protein
MGAVVGHRLDRVVGRRMMGEGKAHPGLGRQFRAAIAGAEQPEKTVCVAPLKFPSASCAPACATVNPIPRPSTGLPRASTNPVANCGTPDSTLSRMRDPVDKSAPGASPAGAAFSTLAIALSPGHLLSLTRHSGTHDNDPVKNDTRREKRKPRSKTERDECRLDRFVSTAHIKLGDELHEQHGRATRIEPYGLRKELGWIFGAGPPAHDQCENAAPVRENEHRTKYQDENA